jgi:hypothetical protein
MLDRITAKVASTTAMRSMPLLAAAVQAIVSLPPIAGRHRLRDRTRVGQGASRMLAWIKRQDESSMSVIVGYAVSHCPMRSFHSLFLSNNP